ncbi:MAG: hypothetical protein WCK27_28630, partial [Verrucomicrobiota bacterium]
PHPRSAEYLRARKNQILISIMTIARNVEFVTPLNLLRFSRRASPDTGAGLPFPAAAAPSAGLQRGLCTQQPTGLKQQQATK